MDVETTMTGKPRNQQLGDAPFFKEKERTTVRRQPHPFACVGKKKIEQQNAQTPKAPFGESPALSSLSMVHRPVYMLRQGWAMLVIFHICVACCVGCWVRLMGERMGKIMSMRTDLVDSDAVFYFQKRAHSRVCHLVVYFTLLVRC